MKLNSMLYALCSMLYALCSMLYALRSTFNFRKSITLLTFWTCCSLSLVAQTINYADSGGSCYTVATQEMTLLGSDGRSPARNIYKDPNNNFNGNIPIRVIWNATFNRWEIQSDLDTNGFYENLDYSNSFASYPNPPAVGTGTWVRHDFLCGSALTFNGTGTQTVLPIELTQFDINTEGGNFQIINLFGQQVLTGKTPPLGAGGLDVSALPQGTYFLKIEAEQAKFIKQ